MISLFLLDIPDIDGLFSLIVHFSGGSSSLSDDLLVVLFDDIFSLQLQTPVQVFDDDNTAANGKPFENLSL